LFWFLREPRFSLSRASAIVRTIAPGNSAIVRGANNGVGIGLVEVYDLDRAVDSKLANISSRGLVQTGDNVMIGGFILLGPDSQKVIVRGIGPSLALPGKLADPMLQLYNGNGSKLDENDNWRSTNANEIIGTGIPPTDDAESALVEYLSPGNYTAILRGSNNATGIAVVQVYALQ